MDSHRSCSWHLGMPSVSAWTRSYKPCFQSQILPQHGSSRPKNVKVVHMLGLELHKYFCNRCWLPPAGLFRRALSWIISFWCKCGHGDGVVCEEKLGRRVRFCPKPPRMYRLTRWATQARPSPRDATLTELRPGAILTLEQDGILSRFQAACRRKLWKNPMVKERGLKVFFEHMHSLDIDRYNSVLLQSCIRSYLSRERMLRQSENLRNILRYGSLPDNSLACVCRAFLSRSYFLRARRMVVTIQRAWRRYFFVLARNRATTIISKTYKMHLAKKELFELQQKHTMLMYQFSSVCKRFLFKQYFKRLTDSKAAAQARATAFPSLSGTLDGCDCWLVYPESDDHFPQGLLVTLFGRRAREITPQRLVTDSSVWLLHKTFNGEALCVLNQEQFWFVYSLKDCHQVEGVARLLEGHSGAVVRSYRSRDNTSFYCVKAGHHPLLMECDLEADEHYTESVVRSRVELAMGRDVVLSSTTTAPEAGPSTLGPLARMVTSKGETMTVEERNRRRRARRAEAKEARKEGAKAPRWQVPHRFRGLTTQEYHEAVQREAEDAFEWVNQPGRSHLPQAVREWFKSVSGSQQWYAVHMFAINRPEFANKQLANINGYLATLGLPAPLKLNQAIISTEIKRRTKAAELRQSQLKAADEVESPAVLAQRAWKTNINQRIAKEVESMMTIGRSNGRWSDEPDDFLPELDW